VVRSKSAATELSLIYADDLNQALSWWKSAVNWPLDPTAHSPHVDPDVDLYKSCSPKSSAMLFDSELDYYPSKYAPSCEATTCVSCVSCNHFSRIIRLSLLLIQRSSLLTESIRGQLKRHINWNVMRLLSRLQWDMLLANRLCRKPAAGGLISYHDVCLSLLIAEVLWLQHCTLFRIFIYGVLHGTNPLLEMKVMWRKISESLLLSTMQTRH